MLFSEPKIPQSYEALHEIIAPRVSVLFSEPKIPQSMNDPRTERVLTGFSALQRAENSSIVARLCWQHVVAQRFSALQRAENSSIAHSSPMYHPSATFQCSSASRKFLNIAGAGSADPVADVSVLFSEPKIPQ